MVQLPVKQNQIVSSIQTGLTWQSKQLSEQWNPVIMKPPCSYSCRLLPCRIPNNLHTSIIVKAEGGTLGRLVTLKKRAHKLVC